MRSRELLVSAGIAGAISPQLKVGDVGRIREVVDVATGERYLTRAGEWVLATSQDVSDAAEKRDLLTKYGADVVDMEAAAVAQVAKERGLEFAAVKAISDDAEFVDAAAEAIHRRGWKVRHRPVPALCRACARSGGRRWERYAPTAGIASANLCREVEHLIDGVAANSSRRDERFL